MAMRYVFFKPLEDVFFDVLMKLDPEFGTKLRSMEPWYVGTAQHECRLQPRRPLLASPRTQAGSRGHPQVGGAHAAPAGHRRHLLHPLYAMQPRRGV
jgi:hypothetical protein